MSAQRFGVIENGTPVYPSGDLPTGVRDVHHVAAPPVVVVSPPEMSNVLYMLQDSLGKLVALLESEVWNRSMPGECVEVMDIERDDQGYITSVTKRKEYR